MTESGDDDTGEGAPRRIDIALNIKHPALTPPEITAALGLEAHNAHCVGTQRKTPKGTLLEGLYPETRWRHSIRHHLDEQWFVDKLMALVERLRPHRDFLHRLVATGGSAEIIVMFLGDGYYGDSMPVEALATLADLKLRLGIEVFEVPQFP